MPRRRYPSDLTEAQWARLESLLPAVRPGGRPRAHPLREIIDAMRYVLRGGIAWRALPHDVPALADGLSLLPRLAPGWDLGAAQRRAARAGAGARRPERAAERGHPG